MVPLGALVEPDAEEEVEAFGEVEVKSPDEAALVDAGFVEVGLATETEVVGMVTVVACSSMLEETALILAPPEATGTLPLVLTLHADLDFLVFERVPLENGDPEAMAPAGAVMPAAEDDFAEETAAALVMAATDEEAADETLVDEAFALDEPLEAPE